MRQRRETVEHKFGTNRMGATHFLTKTLPKVAAEMALYGVALQEVLRKYGAKFLVCGGTFEAVEGKARGRNIVLEFKYYATALACYRSPEYATTKALRAGAVDIDIIVIEGYDGPQPTD